MLEAHLMKKNTETFVNLRPTTSIKIQNSTQV